VEDLSGEIARPPRPLTVSELVGGVRELLEEELGRVQVVGEVSNLFRAASGHSYFTLKDDRAQIKAALFRGSAARIPFDLEEGLEFVVHGEVTLYVQRGDLQIIVRRLEPVGQGALQLAFEQMRERLAAEGLFDATRKRGIPAFPRRVGVVTSPAGAAVRDVVRVSGDRFPATPLLVSPTRVQGDGAEDEIARALARLERIDDIDVILLVRGGGSLEDLWAFNTERVARAIHACPIPVVSGVGHETDVTIADLVADARAATPSAAAMLALPDGDAWRDQVEGLAGRLRRGLAGGLERGRQRLATARARLHAHAPAARLAVDRSRFDAAERALRRLAAAALADRSGRSVQLHARLARAAAGVVPPRRSRRDQLDDRLRRAGPLAVWLRRQRLSEAVARLDALSPLGVLSRGYAIARGPDGRVLHRAQELAPGDSVRVRLSEGEFEAEVTGTVPAPTGGPDRSRR